MARAASSSGFKADIVAWASKVTTRLEELPSDATRFLIDDMRTPHAQGGNMPVITGNLRNSLEVSFNGSRAADRELDPTKLLFDPMPTIAAKVANVKLGQTISASFRAIYGPKAEQNHAFVRLAVQKWDQFVEMAMKQVKARNP